ncbi:MAG TPA: ATPase, T2SS/T4P/T4SS family, partial [Pseudomonadales bacterium]|nr:ATPase, T2SS/T4P/T4SS family [Pseudomonadales bacterium]
YKSEYRFVPKPLGELLIEAGLVTAEQIKKAIFDPNRVPNERIGETLRRHGLVTEEDIGHALGRRFGVPFVKLRGFDFDKNAARCVPANFARKHSVVPLVMDGTKLIVAVADPTDSELINMLRFVTDKVPEIAVATSEDILLAIGECYGQDEVNTALENLEILKQVDPYENSSSEADPVAEKPVVQLVHNLIVDAVVNRASDIHIRPRQNAVDVYFRIDGLLIKQRSFSKPLLPTISTRIKILGNMDISEHRLPQDGRSRIRYANKEIDLRISVMPGIYGEDVVIRLLDTQFAMKRLEDLGYEGNDAEQIRHLLTRNNGLFLVTGPTGSGKSTT